MYRVDYVAIAGR